MNEIINDLPQPIRKFAKMVINTIGTHYLLPFHKYITDAKANEIEIIGKTIDKVSKETNGLSIAYHNNELSITVDNNKSMSNTENAVNNEMPLKRIGERIMFQEIQRQQNIDAVIGNGYEEIAKEQSVSEEPVDQGWAFRFFQYAADICNEDIQKIWGKILAGEVKQPGSCSLRTLEKIKNLSKHEAELFTKIATLVIRCNNAYFIPNEEILYAKYGIVFDEFLNMNECGLIEVIPMLVLSFTIQKDNPTPLSIKQIVSVLSAIEKPVTIQLSQFSLTEAGKQLYKILNLDTNKDFALDYFRFLKDKYKTINVTAHNITTISYDPNTEKDIITYNKDENLLSVS
jgi:hypothetical protein